MKDIDFTSVFEQHQPSRMKNDTEMLHKAAKEVRKMETQLELSSQQHSDANVYSFFLQAVPR